MQARTKEDVINYLVYNLGVYRNQAMAMCNTHEEVVQKGIVSGFYTYRIAEEVLESERIRQGVAELDIDEYYDPEFDDDEFEDDDDDDDDDMDW